MHRTTHNAVPDPEPRLTGRTQSDADHAEEQPSPLTGRTPGEGIDDDASPPPGAGDNAQVGGEMHDRRPTRRGMRWLPAFARDVAVQVVGGLVLLAIAALITLLVTLV